MRDFVKATIKQAKKEAKEDYLNSTKGFEENLNDGFWKKKNEEFAMYRNKNLFQDLRIELSNFIKKQGIRPGTDEFGEEKAKYKLAREFDPKIDYSKLTFQDFLDSKEGSKKHKEPKTTMSTMKEVPYKPRTAMSTTKTVEQAKALLEKDVDKINKDVDKIIEKVSGSVRLTKEQVYQHYKQHGTLPLTAKGKPYKIDIEKYEAKLNKPKRTKKQDKALPMSTTKEVVYHKEKKGRITPQQIYEHYKQHGTVPLTARGTPYKFDVQKYEEKQRREKARLAKGGKRKLTKEQQEEYKRIQEENAKKPKKPDYNYNLNLIDIKAIPISKPKPKESKFTSQEYKEFTKKMDSMVDSFISNYLDMERAISKDEKEFYTEMFKEKGEKVKSGLQTKLATNEWKQEWLDKHGDNLYEALKKLKTMS